MRSAAALLFAFALAVSPAAASQTARPAGGTPADKLPPISYTCPMHPEILEGKGGICPICKMDLVPIRLDSVWTCATRPLAIVQEGPGRCPIDGTALVQVTAAISWSCPGGGQESVSPGSCPDGTPMQKKYASRAHGNHNPQHGGLFFMAADNTHHLEGAYFANGTFRMYFYDEFTKAQTLAAMKSYTATLVVKDPRSGKETPYALVRSGRYLRAQVGQVPLPAEMWARVRFTPDGKDNRFDFTFPAYSKEPHVVGAPALTNAMPPTTAPLVETLPAVTPATLSADSSGGVDPALVTLPIPESVPEILAQLATRTDQIRSFIDKGTFAAIYVPAFQAKDLALALDERKGDLTPERRKIAEPAIASLVRSAYLLDAFGDIGNKQQISEAYAKFVDAAKDIAASFPPSATRHPQ